MAWTGDIIAYGFRSILPEKDGTRVFNEEKFIKRVFDIKLKMLGSKPVGNLYGFIDGAR
jgi:hypothetical protein